MNIFFDNLEENKKLLVEFGHKVSLIKDVRTCEETLIDDEFSKLMAIRIALFNPEVILLWGNDISYSQLAMYKSLIENVDKKVAIVCKSLKGKTEREVGLKDIPIFEFSKSDKFINLLGFAKNLKTILYISAKTNNFNYIKKWPNLNHVFANHGDSDKHSNSDRHSFIYDFEMVADSNAISRFYKQGVEYPINRFIPIGGFVYDGVIAKTSDEKTTFQMGIYAPTWEGHSDLVNFSSVGKIKDQILEYSKIKKIIFRPHPGLGRRLNNFKQSKVDLSKLLIKESKKTKDFNISDFMISDISGVMSEYLFTRKPIIVPITSKDWTKDYVENSNIKEYVYLWEFDKISLNEYIESIKDDPLKEKREKRANELYPGIYSIEDSIKRFQMALDFLSLDCIMKNLRQGRLLSNDLKSCLDYDLKNKIYEKSNMISQSLDNLENLIDEGMFEEAYYYIKNSSDKYLEEIDRFMYIKTKVLFNIKKYDEAYECFNNINKKLFKLDRYAYILKGNICDKLKKSEVALEAYYISARKAPNDKNIVGNYIRYMKKYKSNSEVLKSLNYLVNKKPLMSYIYRLEIAKIHIEEKDFELALKILDETKSEFEVTNEFFEIYGELNLQLDNQRKA